MIKRGFYFQFGGPLLVLAGECVIGRMQCKRQFFNPHLEPFDLVRCESLTVASSVLQSRAMSRESWTSSAFSLSPSGPLEADA